MRSRVVVIGAGHVGSTAAYALMLRGLFAEIVLVDANTKLAEAEAADLADANAITRPARVRAGSFADADGASVVVLTAGAATKGDESRLSVADRSAEIVRECCEGIRAAGFDGVLVVASNPADVMAQVALAASGLPPERVIGTGTLLDSNRLRQSLADQLGVAPASVEAMVLGEHGDSEVAAFSTVRVGGLDLDTFLDGQPIDRAAIAEEVRCAAYAIVAGKGHTAFGVATAIVRICEAVVRDEHVVLPVATLVDGPYCIEGVVLSLPCVVGARGVERVLVPDLDEQERAALLRSAATLKATVEGLG